MRTDTDLGESLVRSKEWQTTRFSMKLDYGRVSFSGHERNRFFKNISGEGFKDTSALSGLDSDRDGRTFVLWDYDRDGRQDIAIVNAGAPLLNLYRNEIDTAGRMIALRFVGGNKTAAASNLAPRDAYGAVAILDLGEMTVRRELRCGEGFAGQNSATLIVGIGTHDHARTLTVRWPSGTVRVIENVAAGTMVTAYENPKDSPDGSGFLAAPYEPVTQRAPETRLGKRFQLGPATGAAPLRIYTTMATWCAACKKELPQLARIRKLHGANELEMIGLPSDPEDTPQELAAYKERHRPAYQLLTGLDDAAREKLERVLGGNRSLPASIVTDADGRVLGTFRGVPTVSQLRALR